MLYGEPRSFMVFDDIKVSECIPDFGSPSGHMFTESTLYYCLFHMYLVPWVQNRKIQKAAIAKGQPLYNDDIKSGGNYQFGVIPALLGVVCLIFIAGMGISRIYLGEHSYNQIILGFMHSTAFTIYLFILVDEPWGRFLLRLVDKPWRESKKALIIITLAFIVFLIFPIIVFEVQKATLKDDPNWIRNIAKKCNVTDMNKILCPYDFANCGIIAVLFGGLYALIFSNGSYHRRYKSERISLSKEMLRIFLLFLVIAPGVLFLEFIPWDNPYLSFFVVHSLCYFITVYAIYSIWPYLLYKFKAEKQGDLLRQSQHTLNPISLTPDAQNSRIDIGNKTEKQGVEQLYERLV